MLQPIKSGLVTQADNLLLVGVRSNGMDRGPSRAGTELLQFGIGSPIDLSLLVVEVRSDKTPLPMTDFGCLMTGIFDARAKKP